MEREDAPQMIGLFLCLEKNFEKSYHKWLCLVKKIMHMCNVYVAKAVLENVTLRATILNMKFDILIEKENRNCHCKSNEVVLQ